MNIVQPNYPAWNGTPAYRDMSVVTDCIVHHGDDSINTTPLQIDEQHRSQGWDGIGYHLLVAKGVIYRGRPFDMVPAAAAGDNYGSIDICMVGDYQPGTDGYDGNPSPENLQALADAVVYAHQQVPTIVRTIGHRDVSVMVGCPNDATACPGQSLYNLLPDIRSYVHDKLGH